MVIISESVENALNRIFLIGIANNGMPPKIYFDCKEAINNLDKISLNIFANSVSNAPFAWKRDNMLICKVGKYCFSYTKIQSENGVSVVVEEMAENGIIITETKCHNVTDRNIIQITESQLCKIVIDAIRKII